MPLLIELASCDYQVSLWTQDTRRNLEYTLMRGYCTKAAIEAVANPLSNAIQSLFRNTATAGPCMEREYYSQQVPNMLIRALFSAALTLNPQTYLTRTHIFAYVQW